MRRQIRVLQSSPGSLTEAQARALWRLRTSLLQLKPHVDPDQDFAGFRRFVDAAHVAWAVDCDGQALAMLCHQRIDGRFAGARYRLALFEYGFIDPRARGDLRVTLGLARQLLACRTVDPRAHDYFVGVGYPRSAVLLNRMIPDLRLGGDPSLTPIERALVEQVIERLGPSKFDRQRCVAELPTIPEPIRADWQARHEHHPLLRAYLTAVPDWEQGRAALVIGRLDGSLTALARDVQRRLIGGFGPRVAARVLG